MSRRRRRRSFSILPSRSSKGEPGFESFDIGHLNKTKIGHVDRTTLERGPRKRTCPAQLEQIPRNQEISSDDSLRVRRHLLFFEHDVLTNDRIVFLQLKLALL